MGEFTVDPQAPPPAPDPGITIRQATAETPLQADNKLVTLSVVPSPGSFDKGRIFMRRAIKGVMTPNAQHINWLVGELNGVRVYCDGTSVVLTTLDMNP